MTSPDDLAASALEAIEAHTRAGSERVRQLAAEAKERLQSGLLNVRSKAEPAVPAESQGSGLGDWDREALGLETDEPFSFDEPVDPVAPDAADDGPVDDFAFDMPLDDFSVATDDEGIPLG